MSFSEAKEQLKLPPEGSYVVLTTAYDSKLVLEYEAGITVLKALEKAELLNDGYSDRPGIGPLTCDKFKLTTISKTEYERMKMAYLMGITLKEMDEIMKGEVNAVN